MKKEKLKEKALSLDRWVWEEKPDASLWERGIRNFLRMCYFFYHEVRRNALTLRASALTYIIILSMVPLLALSTAVLKGLGAGKEVKRTVYQLIERLDEMTSTNPQEPKKSPFTQHIKEAVDKIFVYVERTNFATLGIVGILGLIWAVVSALTKIEQALNQIWKVQKTRPLGRRILDYTALTVIMPISINLAWGTLAASHIKRTLSLVDRYLPFPLLTTLFIKIVPLLILVATFVIFYKFLPNTKVKTSAALAGGIIGSIGWLLVQILYIKLQIGITRYNAIYGSFATIPLFLIWVYWDWLVFLCGAQASYVIQYWRTYRPGVEPKPALKLAAAIEIARLAYIQFIRGAELKAELASQLTGYPQYMIDEIIEELEKKNLLKRTENGGYLPARPLEVLEPSEILDAVYGTVKGKKYAERLTEEALGAAKETLNRRGLKIEHV